MKRMARPLLLLWLLLTAVAPARANNPPAPDGALSLLLLFPVAILALRWAGAVLPESRRKHCTLKGVGLGLVFFLTMGGTEVALIPLLILLCYGLFRGASVMRYGQGWKRFAVGTGVILFTLFAVTNYAASLNNWPSASRTETGAAFAVRAVTAAQTEFRSAARLDANKNGAGEFGTLGQLRDARLLDDYVWRQMDGGSYRYAVVLTGSPAEDEKRFFVYATPAYYGDPPRQLSLLAAFRPAKPHGRRTFAADESGVVRSRDLGAARPVTREETQKWPGS